MGIRPIIEELAGFPDPVSIYRALRDEPYSSFLDSGMDAGKLGRFSFIGYSQPELVVEDFSKLLRRGDIEFLSGFFVDLFFELFQIAIEFRGHLLQEARIQLDAIPFHLGENIDQRRLDVLE